MWQCPKCRRIFEIETLDHHCSEDRTPIDAYIAEQPDEIRPCLIQVRNSIRAVLPDAQERISWRMPTFWKGHNIIHFAAHKNHIGLYPGPEAIVHFSEKLTNYKTSKGAVQLPYNNEIPLDLIGEITKWCYETGNHH